MRRRDVVTALALVPTMAAGAVLAQTAGGERGLDVARRNFARAVTASLGMPAETFHVEPPAGVEAISSHDALKYGTLHAWSAVDTAGRIRVKGFSGVGPGARIAFEGYVAEGIGMPGGLAALMEALAVLDAARRPALDDIVKRVAFCLNRFDTGEFTYDPVVAEASGFVPPAEVGPPSIVMGPAGATLTYFTMVQGFTGTFEYGQVTVTVKAGSHETGITRTPLAY